MVKQQEMLSLTADLKHESMALSVALKRETQRNRVVECDVLLK